ncbi:MAG: hypothetical protein HQL54_07335 [Magnetococcales bacterium]|nr:hypothetical protein [Magnetococcales bacterium]
MSSLTINVVSEGPSDFPLIKGVVDEIARRQKKEVTCNLLEPQISASGQKGGWKNIRNWCWNQSRKPAGLDLLFFRADILLIQMDTDISDGLSLDGKEWPGGDTQERKNWCASALNSWLGAFYSDERLIYLLSTMSIETWLLSTYGPENAPDYFSRQVPDYETIPDPEGCLLELGYERKRSSSIKLKKNSPLFEDDPRYRQRLQNNLDTARNRCPELDQFCHFLESYTKP